MTSAATAGTPAAVTEAARDTLGGALARAKELLPDVGIALAGTGRAAFTEAVVLTASVSAALALAAAIATATLLRNGGLHGRSACGIEQPARVERRGRRVLAVGEGRARAGRARAGRAIELEGEQRDHGRASWSRSVVSFRSGARGARQGTLRRTGSAVRAHRGFSGKVRADYDAALLVDPRLAVGRYDRALLHMYRSELARLALRPAEAHSALERARADAREALALVAADHPWRWRLAALAGELG